MKPEIQQVYFLTQSKVVGAVSVFYVNLLVNHHQMKWNMFKFIVQNGFFVTIQFYSASKSRLLRKEIRLWQRGALLIEIDTCSTCLAII